MKNNQRHSLNWEKPTIELPPGWKAAVERIALEINAGRRGMMRYVWALAVDQLLKMDLDTIKSQARELQRMELDEFEALVAKHCDDPVVVAELAVRETPPGESARSRRNPVIAGEVAG